MVTILCSKYGRMQKKAFFKWTRLCITVKFCVRKAVFNYTEGGSIMDMSNTYALTGPFNILIKRGFIYILKE